MSDSLMDELLEELERASREQEVRVVVLTGAGRAFSSGGDHANAELESDIHDLMRRQSSVQLLRGMGKPTVASINGVVAGAGLGLALAADLRIAAESARFVPAFAPLGASGDFGVTYSLSRLVGREQALRFMLLGQTWDARTARRLGLVGDVVPDKDLSAATEDLALVLARAAPLAQIAIKRNLLAAERSDFDTLLWLEAEAMMRLRETSDMKEAIAAFKEKRPPRFGGR